MAPERAGEEAYVEQAVNARYRHRILTPDEEQDLARTMRAGGAAGEAARETLVAHNQRLIASIASKYMGEAARYGLDIGDLVQEGNIGLFKALDKFEPERGLKLSTFATWWIRQSVQRALLDRGRAIRLPVHVQEAMQQLGKTQQRLAAELNRLPTNAELAAAMKLPMKKIEQLLSLVPLTQSLDAVLDDDSERTLYAVTPLPDPDPGTAAVEGVMAARLAQVLDRLAPREQEIIRFRYGLDDGEHHTLDEVGSRLGITRERVRQIESKVLRRLRFELRHDRDDLLAA